ncbi:hypothetical protein [Parapedobacter sp. 10938]|uniref:hypothetical protein n=1 Tax=Parapedobacter flavus TaxID=3110225 RepID=UPI002DC058E2|nr:hypothetical protein [Parapedobacter sp. 10938]MEC3880043.1 hypothetical protein [Parapedobacter sp. 10938]
MEIPIPVEKPVEFIFYNLNSQISHDISATIIGAGLFLGDKVVVAGDMHLIVVSDVELNITKPKSQLAYMRVIYEGMGQAKAVQTIDQLTHMLDRAMKDKHPSAQLLVLRTKALRAIAKQFDDFRQWMTKGFSAIRIGQLKKLNTDTDAPMEMVPMALDIPESIDGGKYGRVSDVMMCPADSSLPTRDILMLPGDCAELMESPDFRSIGVIELPEPSPLTVEEIRLVRKQTREIRADFIAAVSSIPNIPSSARPAPPDQYAARLQELGEALQQNRTLQTLSKATDAPPIQVTLAVAPLQIIWQYYRRIGLVPDETWALLQQCVEESNALVAAVPVIIIKPATDLS